MPLLELRRVDTLAIPTFLHEIRAFLCVKNEVDRLPWSLQYHRTRGVDRFFVVDNDSTDDTLELLLEQPDVHVFRASGDYERSRNGLDWVEGLLQVYGRERWCLIIDADEQFVYPDCETLGLRHYCQLLTDRSIGFVQSLFIDLYSDRPILQTQLQPDVDPRSLYRYFDASGYVDLRAPGRLLPTRYGGPRARLFWPDIDLNGYAQRRRTIAEAAFDEDAYLRHNADVAKSVGDGIVSSGFEHYVRYGHQEGRDVSLRKTSEWHEPEYLSLHADVQRWVDETAGRSGLEHFLRFGYFEERLLQPTFPPCLTQVPLVYWRNGYTLEIGRHRLLAHGNAKASAEGAALLHFRLDQSMASEAVGPNHDYCERSVWRAERTRYAEALAQHPSLSAMAPVSVPYVDSRQLVELGLVRTLLAEPGRD